MSHYNTSYGNDGGEHMPPSASGPFTQPAFLTLQEIESVQFSYGTQTHRNQLNYSKNHTHDRNNSNALPTIYIGHSNLQPTAQEFHPAVIYQGGFYNPLQSETAETPQSMQHTGAIRRCNQKSSHTVQQGRVNNQNREYSSKDSFKGKKKQQQSGDNAAERLDEQIGRRQSSGHYQDKPQPNQQQNRYNQNQDAGNSNYTYNNNGNNSNNGNKFKGYRNGYQTDQRQYKPKPYNGRENNWERDGDNTVERDVGNRRSYKERDNRDRKNQFYNRDRENYKDNRQQNTTPINRSSHKNWRVRSNNKKPVDNISDEKSSDAGNICLSDTKDKIKQSIDSTNASASGRFNKQDNSYKKKYENSYHDRSDYCSSSTINGKSNKQEILSKKMLDAASQRERLEHMLTHRMIECLVCCEKVRPNDRVWSCKQCFNILHLSCVQKWAKSSKLESGWRCPACQNVLDLVPTEYSCYCDKYLDPKYEPGLLAHSCGEVCRRNGRHCEHTCTLLCHPGPCPDCTAMVQKSCGCGATRVTVKCTSNLPLTCDAVCNKLLNCEVHVCKESCHWNQCMKCDEKVKQECYCGKQGRKVDCLADTKDVKKYECGDVCGKLLTCGNHKCVQMCHSGDCSPCPTDPQSVRSCPCGKQSLAAERKSCLDPIPCCDKICDRVLTCGQPSKPHRCKETCHNGECPPCPATTMVRCRCGHMYKEIACRDLTTKADDARCQKKCTKMRMCSKHKCNQYCCIEVEHRCPLPCNRNLSCGLHKCESTCHSGRCEPCWHTSFEELYCECGASVTYPPVPCGTRAPACSKQCSRPRLCGHEPHHNCHTGTCPPCTLFTTKLCHGGHESRGTIPCHQEDFSCGLPCNHDMPCGHHRCIQVCHKGPCPSPCTQPCIVPKHNCEHLCNRPCHEPPCPPKPCKQQVITSCQCGLRTGTNICMNMTAEYQKMTMLQMSARMGEMNRGNVVEIMDIGKQLKKGGPHKILECNDECKLVERNRRMAIGLQIRNPDLSAKLTPRYTDYLKQWAKKDPKFCQTIHDKLTELVQLAKQSKQKSRSHSFECMNREKRHFVHELCEHFGVESAAYDAEPNRNVVATASKEKSWLPSCSLIELLQRENGQRKVPGPVLKPPVRNINAPSSSSNSGGSVSLRLQSGRTTALRPATPTGEYIDYFENPPL